MKRAFCIIELRQCARVCSALLLAGLFVCSLGAHAQAYPSRPIKVISPWPSGGPADSVIRPLTEKLSLALGQPVVLITMPGANGTIGTAWVAKAVPDGYTLLFSNVSPMAISPNVQSNLPYDPVRDFEPITLLTSTPQFLTVRGDLPVRSVQELIAYGKASPSKLNMGSVGIGSASHLEAELLRVMSGLEFVHIPYKGAAPALTDMLGGQIDFSFFNLQAIAPFLAAGKVRALATTSLERSPLAPGVPTLAESLPGYEMSAWFGMEAPAGTPIAILDRLNTELVKILRSPEESERLHRAGFEVEASTREQHGRQVRADVAKFAGLVKAVGGIKID